MKKSLKISKRITAAVLALLTASSVTYGGVYAEESTDDDMAQFMTDRLAEQGQRGDYNGDGIINVFDLIRYKNSIVENKNTDSVINSRLDINGDRKITGTDADAVKKDILRQSKLWRIDNIPVMDGSTSAIPLEAGFKSKMLGISYSDAKKIVKHHKTHESFSMLLSGENDMIFTVPISESQQKAADEAGVHLNLVPVAREGFVFVVNKDNPVDSLTQQQIRDIYSGKITNWKEVGGNDEKIVPYQRNNDSGSQNYIVDFMKGSDLMTPPKDYMIGSMASLMDRLAVYDNAVNSIGYSVYSYAAQMYENSSEVKFIAVDGIRPTRETMADGTYPLLSGTYIMYTDDAPQRTLDFARWAVSEEGQKCVLSCGYVPVTDMEYPEELKPYRAVGTGKEKPADYSPSKIRSLFSQPVDADEKYGTYSVDFLKDKEYQEEINRDLAEVCSKIHGEPRVSAQIINGFMSIEIESGKETVYYTPEISTEEYTVINYLNYDLRNNRKIEKFSDLFYSGTDFIQTLNREIEKIINERVSPYLKTDFIGLLGSEINFSADCICFDKTGPYMEKTVSLSFSDSAPQFADIMVTGEYFDNEEILDDRYSSYDVRYAEWNNSITMDENGEPHTVVLSSRFHTAEEVGERNKIYEKIWNEARKIREEEGISASSKIIISEPENGFYYDELNVFNVNFGKLDGPSNSRYMFDTETGERVYLSDIFGKEIKTDERSVCYRLNINEGTAEISYDGKIGIQNFDPEKINSKYIIKRENDVKTYSLSKPLRGIARGVEPTEYYGVYGYASSYILDFGPEKKQWPIEGDWHIIAKNKCYSHGSAWYECWDADDGDYYGWIRNSDLLF